jgi:hypothetical protein
MTPKAQRGFRDLQTLVVAKSGGIHRSKRFATSAAHP